MGRQALEQRFYDLIDHGVAQIKLTSELKDALTESGTSDYIYDFQIIKMKKFIEYVFKQRLPLNIGDSVKLKKSPDFNCSPGWDHCKHFLKKGAVGEVRDIDFSAENDMLFAQVMFGDETWIDRQGVKHEVKDKHVFRFSEDKLRKINA